MSAARRTHINLPYRFIEVSPSFLLYIVQKHEPIVKRGKKLIAQNIGGVI
jgi:hypothetical protein